MEKIEHAYATYQAAFKEAAAAVPPEKLIAYLKSRGWTPWEQEQEDDRPRRRVAWEKVDAESRAVATVLIPLVPSLPDFESDYLTALSAVAVIEEWPMVLELPEALR